MVYNVIMIIVSKMTSQCMVSEQMKSEVRTRKREEMRFKTRAKGRERWSSGDMEWRKTVPQTTGCNRKCSVANGRQLSLCEILSHRMYSLILTQAQR